MALEQTHDITPESLIERFQSAVVANILKDAYHSGRIPYCRGWQCVPTHMMDHINNVNRTPSIGNKGTIVNAQTVLDGLISVTRNLTRVGTYSYSLWKDHTESGTDRWNNKRPYKAWIEFIASSSAKVIFTQSYINSYFNDPPDIQNTVFGGTIVASNLNQLLANIYQHWVDWAKHHHNGEGRTCHGVCHEDCHDHCHWICHSTCHGWTVMMYI
jgi:hypothetical protein